MTNVNELVIISKEEYDPTERVTLTDLAEAFGINRLTANKRLVKAGVDAVARLNTGKAGRPAVLFPRADADAALVAKQPRKTRQRSVSDHDVVLDAVAAAMPQ